MVRYFKDENKKSTKQSEKNVANHKIEITWNISLYFYKNYFCYRNCDRKWSNGNAITKKVACGILLVDKVLNEVVVQKYNEHWKIYDRAQQNSIPSDKFYKQVRKIM